MKIGGYILFFAGIMPAFVFAAKIPVAWIYFVVSVLVAAVGAVLTRFGGDAKKTEKDAQKTGDVLGASDLVSIVNEIDEKLKTLVGKFEVGDSEKLKAEIESVQDRMLEFIDNRSALQREFDFKTVSEIYIFFAGGERYVHRAWSSLVDGYIKETEASLKIASQKFSETIQLCNNIS